MKKITMLNKIKTIIASALCLALVIALCSCAAAKKAITSEDFASTAKELGYQAENITPDESKYDYVVSSYCAQKQNVDDDHWFVLFTTAKTAQDAEGIFANNKSKYSNGLSSNVTEFNGNNYSSYQGDKEGKFLFVEYIDDTVLCVEVDLEYKDEAKKLIEALGY